MNNDLVTLNGTLSPEVSDRVMNRIKVAIQREGSNVMKNVVLTHMHEQGRAILAKTALENVGALSALEAHLYKIAPLGEENYRQILNAYTLGAARTIVRW